MSTMINEIFVDFNKVMGKFSIYDAKFICESTCWVCDDEALYNLYLDTLADIAD